MLLSLALSTALAQEPDAPTSVSYSADIASSWIAGNLNQLQVTAGGELRVHGPAAGNDLLVSAYRLWMGPPGASGLVRTGDDVAVTTLPYRSFTETLSVIGLGHFSYSQLHQIDGRWLGGGALGCTPVDTPAKSLRLGIGGAAERPRYPGDTFNRPVAHDEGVRTVARATLIGSGTLRPKGSTVSVRGLGWLHVNPADLGDIRASLDTSLGIPIAGPVMLQLGVVATYNSVVLEGVETYDLRSRIGLRLQPPAPGT